MKTKTKEPEDRALFVNRTTVTRIIQLVDRGLIRGLGTADPGKMCVEAAVCYGMGYAHSDSPQCVNEDLIRFKIILNDAGGWPSEAARAKGLRAVAVAQLGTRTKDFDAGRCAYLVFVQAARQVIPFALQILAKNSYSKEIKKQALLYANQIKDVKIGKSGNSRLVRDIYHFCSTTNYATFSREIDKRTPDHHERVRVIDHVRTLLNDFTEAIPTDFNDLARILIRQQHFTATDEHKHQLLLLIANCLLEALKTMKTPGCQWLHLLDEKLPQQIAPLRY